MRWVKASLIGLSCNLHLPASPAGLLPEVFEDTSLGYIHDGLLKGKVGSQLTVSPCLHSHATCCSVRQIKSVR